VAQELLTILEHVAFSGVRVARSLVLSVIFCSSFFVIFVSFFWPLYCLSLDLRASDYPFVIFKLFLIIHAVHPVLTYREISILLFNISKMLRYYPKGVFTILLIHDCNSLLTVNKIMLVANIVIFNFTHETYNKS